MAKRLSDAEKIEKKRNELRQLENQQLIAQLADWNKKQDFEEVAAVAMALHEANIQDDPTEAKP